MPQIHGKQIQDTSIALTKLTEAVIQADGGQAFTNNQSMGNNKLTALAPGTVSTDAVNKGQLDAISAGVSWREPVQARHYLGTFSISGINALSPTSGQAVTALSAGTPSAGTSDVLAIGDVAEFDGTSWKKIISNSGGFVPDGTRMIISDTGTLETSSASGDLIEGTDNGKIAVFDGTSNNPAELITPNNGDAVLCNQAGSTFENRGFTYDTTPTIAWIEFTGLAQVTAGNGLAKVGNTLSVDTDTETGGNIQGANVTANGVGLDVAAIAGTGLEADGSANLRVAAQGNGLTGGGGTTLSVQADGTSVSVGASGIKSAVLTQAYKNITALATTGNGDKAVTTTIATADLPKGDTDVMVFVNGVKVYVTDDNSGEAYFGQGDTTTARDKTDLANNDTLRWNGSVAGFQLAVTDKIDIVLMTHE